MHQGARRGGRRATGQIPRKNVPRKDKRPPEHSSGGRWFLTVKETVQIQPVLRGQDLAAAAAGRFTSRGAAGVAAARAAATVTVVAATLLAALGRTAGRLAASGLAATALAATVTVVAATLLAAAIAAAWGRTAARLASATGGSRTARSSFAARSSSRTARRLGGTTRGLTTAAAAAENARLRIRSADDKQAGNQQGRQHKTFHGTDLLKNRKNLWCFHASLHVPLTSASGASWRVSIQAGK